MFYVLGATLSLVRFGGFGFEVSDEVFYGVDFMFLIV